MPPIRKVDRLTPELKTWLQEELKARGFGEYVDVTDALNAKLEASGEELRIGKSAVHAFGTEYEEFVKYQNEASAWAADWMNDNGLKEEAKRHNVLFQMVTTLAFKHMQGQMAKGADEIDPRNLHVLGKMMKDSLASSGIREKLMDDERARIAEEARKLADAAANERFEDVIGEAGLSEDRISAMRTKFLGLKS